MELNTTERSVSDQLFSGIRVAVLLVSDGLLAFYAFKLVFALDQFRVALDAFK